jgi:hypothetical protein
MSEIVLRFEHKVGRAALKLWSQLPRDLQEQLSRMRLAVTSNSGINLRSIYTIIIREPLIHLSRRRSPEQGRTKHILLVIPGETGGAENCQHCSVGTMGIVGC